MHKNDKHTCSACKTIAFSHKICRFVAFLVSSSLPLLKVAIAAELTR